MRPRAVLPPEIAGLRFTRASFAGGVLVALLPDRQTLRVVFTPVGEAAYWRFYPAAHA